MFLLSISIYTLIVLGNFSKMQLRFVDRLLETYSRSIGIDVSGLSTMPWNPLFSDIHLVSFISNDLFQQLVDNFWFLCPLLNFEDMTMGVAYFISIKLLKFSFSMNFFWVFLECFGKKLVLLLNSFLSELVVAYFLPKISTGWKYCCL